MSMLEHYKSLIIIVNAIISSYTHMEKIKGIGQLLEKMLKRNVRALKVNVKALKA